MAATSVGQIGLDLVVNQNQFKSQMQGIQSLAKKAGATLAAAFGVKKLIDFGKSCLELGSDLAEVQNVVDVTFPTMTAQVDKFAKSAAQSFGLSETMAKQFTGTFGAMAKAFGFSEKQAYDMGSSLTQLAGDVASFYNLSQDEAYTKLKSVFTGETESLKDLGVVMTQTALDSYALANGFGKTTSQMTEAEKVALRYSFVQKQLSAAQGDFARTSDSWANQVRILTLQFDSLKATIGQGLINLFTPVIKVINTVIGKLAILANAFKSFTELITGQKSSNSASGQISAIGSAATDASIGMDDAASSADNLSSSNNSVAKSAQKAAEKMRALMGFDQVNKLDSQSSTSSSTPSTGTGTSGIGGTGVDFGSLAKGETVVDTAEKKLTKLFQNIKKLCAPATQSLKRLWNEGLAKLGTFTLGSLKDFFSNFLVPIGKWTLGTGIPRFIDALNNGLMKVNFDKIRDSLNGLWKALAPFAIHVGEGLLWFWENVLVPLGSWTANEVVPRFLDMLSSAIGIFNGIIEALQPLARWFWDSFLQPLGQWTGNAIIVALESLVGLLQGFSSWIQNNQGLVEGITIVIGSFFAAFKLHSIIGTAAGVITNFVGLITSGGGLLGALSSVVAALGGPVTIAIGAVIAAGVLLWRNWDTVKEAAGKLKDWVVDKTIALKDGAVQAFNTLKTNAGNALTALHDDVKQKWEIIKSKFSSFTTWLGSVFNTDWTKQFGIFGGVLNGFFKSAKDVTEDIKGIFKGLNTFISGAFSGNWKKAWKGIKDIFSNVFRGLANIAKTPINAIIGGFNGVLGTVNGLISKLNNLKFKITVPDWVPGVGGSWWGFNGFNIPTIGTIPMLANGGFVKANTPQLAMIGDNRHQGEVVSPEDKLQEMALKAASLAAGGASDAELLAVLKQILSFLQNTPIVALDPETLRKYFIRKTNQNTKATGKPELIV